MEKKKVEKELNRLLTEYEIKLDKCKSERRAILIDFTREYNKIWKDGK